MITVLVTPGYMAGITSPTSTGLRNNSYNCNNSLQKTPTLITIACRRNCCSRVECSFQFPFVKAAKIALPFTGSSLCVVFSVQFSSLRSAVIVFFFFVGPTICLPTTQVVCLFLIAATSFSLPPARRSSFFCKCRQSILVLPCLRCLALARRCSRCRWRCRYI